MSKYPRTFHLDYSLGVSSDDKIATNIDNLINSNTTIIITEKLDGENQAITMNGVYARSHSTFTTNPWSQKSWELFYKISKDINEGLYLFGENMYGVHSLEYNCLKSYFYLFGLRQDDTFLSWDKVEEYSYLLDIPTTPVLFKGIVKSEKELKELVLSLVKQPSNLGSSQMEGCVVRLYDSFNQEDFSKSVVKWVRKDHVTTDKHWSKNYKIAKLI